MADVPEQEAARNTSTEQSELIKINHIEIGSEDYETRFRSSSGRKNSVFILVQQSNFNAFSIFEFCV